MGITWNIHILGKLDHIRLEYIGDLITKLVISNKRIKIIIYENNGYQICIKIN